MAIFSRMALLGLLLVAVAMIEHRCSSENSSGKLSRKETGDDDGEIHIIYPSSSMCQCYIIFDDPENVLQEAEAMAICTEDLGLPSFQTYQSAPDNLQDVLLQAACRNVIVDYPKEETSGVSQDCFLRANVVHERWRLAYKYWQSLNDSADQFFTCFGRTMNWLTDDGSINKDGVKAQVQVVEQYSSSFMEEVMKSIDECEEPNANLGAAQKIMAFFKCAYALCHDEKQDEDEA